MRKRRCTFFIIYLNHSSVVSLCNSYLFFFSPEKQPPRDECYKLESATEVRTRPNGKSTRPPSPHKVCKDASSTNRRNRFIVLGSSGEVLPVTRKSLGQMSVYSSCNSQSTDSFHSAKETIDEEPGMYLHSK